MLIELESAFLLHSRAYRDTSMLLEAFTRNHGRISLIARGVKGKKGARANVLQAFSPLLLSWWGRGELGTLRGAELQGHPSWLTGNRLVSGLYVNELLHRLLDRHEPHEALFDYYAATIQQICSAEMGQLASVLRFFEKFLITQLGYGLVFNVDALTGATIEPDCYYIFDPGIGCYQRGNAVTTHSYKGSSLLALYHEQLNSAEELQDAKRLMRAVLTAHLGAKPIYSRELWC